MTLRSTLFRRIFSVMMLLSLCSVGALAHAQLVVVANQNSPATQLSIDEVRQIFLGRLQLFPGSNTNIQVLDQKENSAIFDRFYKQVARKNAMQITRYRAGFLFGGRGRLPKVVDGDRAVLDAILKQHGAIGYVHRDSVTGQPVKILLEIP